jgi:hypothetical protein
VHAAFCREALAPPSPEAGAKLKTGKPCHQVELGRVGVADLNGIEANSLLAQADVLGVHSLLSRVVARDVEPYRVEPDAFRLGALLAIEAVQVGDESLHDEYTALGQVRGHVAKTTHLRFLRLKRKKCIEDDVNEWVATFDRDVGEVADGDRDPVPARFRTQPRGHRFRGVDAVHLDAELDERQCDAPRSNREFERGSGASKLGEEGDGRVRVEGTLLNPLVVDLGEAVAVGRGAVLLDGLDPTSDTARA